MTRSPDTGIAARSYHQVSVLAEQHRPNAANMALHHRHNSCFWCHIKQMQHTVLGSCGHKWSASVVHHPIRVFSAKSKHTNHTGVTAAVWENVRAGFIQVFLKYPRTHSLVENHFGKISATINISLLHLYGFGFDFGISSLKWLDLWNQRKNNQCIDNRFLVQRLC